MLKLFALSLALGCSLAGIPGGFFPADVNSPDVKNMATFAVSYLNGLDERATDVTVTRVVKAERQVVAGFNYLLHIEVTESHCSSNCRHEMCEVTVYDQEWTHTRKVTHFHCNPKTVRGVMVGGVHAIPTDSVEVQNAAQFAVTALNKMSNSMYASSLVDVKSADSQVVAGVKYNLVIGIRSTKCRNVPGMDLSECAFDTNSQAQTCKLSIVWQAWLNPQYTLLDGAHCM